MAFLLTPLITLMSFLVDYIKGFQTAEILARRVDLIQTTILTILIMNGFKPVFLLVKNSCLFLKDLFLGFFFPQKKLQNLTFNQDKNLFKKEQLEAKIRQLENLNNKLEKEIEKVDFKIKKKGKKEIEDE